MREKISVDIPEMIKLIGESLYTTPDVVFRELIQNCYDSTLQKYGSNTPIEGRISVNIFKTERAIEFCDNGVGMNDNELRGYLSKMGQSIKKVHSAVKRKTEFIGEFGIGFFCSFMICEQIIVTTKKSGEQNGWRWTSHALDEYDLEKIEEDTVLAGTTVRLLLQRGLNQYLDPVRIQKIIRHYCDYIDCPIILNNSDKPINCKKFAWELKRADDQEKWIQGNFDTHPLYHLTGSVSTRNISYSYIFIIPDPISYSHQIYCRRMFVTKSLRFMPNYLRFIDVLVNCSELNLDMSREQIKQDSTFHALVENIEELAVKWLRNLIKRHYKEPKFKKIIKDNQYIFRMLAFKSDALFNKVYHCFLFTLANSNNEITIDEYADRMDKDERRLLYITRHKSRPHSEKEHERLLLLICEERKIPVIKIETEEDDELLRKVCIKLNLTKTKLVECMDLFVDRNGQGTNLLEAVRRNFEHFFPSRCRVESFPPPSLPMLIQRDDIVLNENNTFLINLSNLNTKIDNLRSLYTCLYYIIKELDRSNLEKNILENIISAVVKSFDSWGDHLNQWNEDEKKLRQLSHRWWTGPISIDKLGSHRREFVRRGKAFKLRCFIVCSFSKLYRDVINVCKSVCESHHIFAETAEEIDSRDILEKVCLRVDECDFAIVDISENNPNVLLELGLLIARRKPAIIIRNKSFDKLNTIKVPTDIIGIERIEYENTSEDLSNKMHSVCQKITV